MKSATITTNCHKTRAESTPSRHMQACYPVYFRVHFLHVCQVVFPVGRISGTEIRNRNYMSKAGCFTLIILLDTSVFSFSIRVIYIALHILLTRDIYDENRLLFNPGSALDEFNSVCVCVCVCVWSICSLSGISHLCLQC